MVRCAVWPRLWDSIVTATMTRRENRRKLDRGLYTGRDFYAAAAANRRKTKTLTVEACAMGYGLRPGQRKCVE